VDLDKQIIILEDEIRAVVSFGNDFEIISLTKKQTLFLKNLLDTGSVKVAAQMAGISQETAHRYFKDPRFVAFVDERVKNEAKLKGYNLARWASRLVDCFEGKIKLDKNALRAGEILGKALGYLVDKKIYDLGDNVEVLFQYQKNSANNTNNASREPRDSGEPSEPLHNLNGGAPFWKNEASPVEADPSVSQA